MDEAQNTVGKAISKFLRTHTLRRISNNFAEFLEFDNPDLPASPHSPRAVYDEPLVFVDKQSGFFLFFSSSAVSCLFPVRK